MEHSTPQSLATLSGLLTQLPRQALLGTGVMLLLVGGLVAWNRYAPPADVPLPNWENVSRQEFDSLQQQLKSRLLSRARLVDGVVLVPADDLQNYIQAVPPRRQSAASTEHWADVWQQANDRLGRFSGTRERDAAREIARAQVVSRLLSDLPDIASADVVWDEDVNTGWRREHETRATVYLRAIEGKVITPQMAHAVRLAVAGSKSHLAPEAVVVFDQGTMTAFPADHAAATRTAAAEQHSQSLQRKLAAALDYIDGVRVTVHVPERVVASNESSDLANGQDSVAGPVAVTVSIPETYLRAIAGLDAGGQVRPSDTQTIEKRRDLFRRVEAQVSQNVHEKVARLVPGGMTEAGWQHIAVDTLPTPIAATAVKKQFDGVSMATVMTPGVMRLLAILSGLAAISLLFPRRKGVESQPIATNGASPNDNAYPDENASSSQFGQSSYEDNTAIHEAYEAESFDEESHHQTAVSSSDELSYPEPSHQTVAPPQMPPSRRAQLPIRTFQDDKEDEPESPQPVARTEETPRRSFVPPVTHQRPRGLSPLERALSQLDPIAGDNECAPIHSPGVNMSSSLVSDEHRPATETSTSDDRDPTTVRTAEDAVRRNVATHYETTANTSRTLAQESRPPVSMVAAPALIPGGQRCGGAAYERARQATAPSVSSQSVAASRKNSSKTTTALRSTERKSGGPLRQPSPPLSAVERAIDRTPKQEADPVERGPVSVYSAPSRFPLANIESLCDAPLELIQNVAQEVPAEVWSRALFGASSQLKDCILPSLPDISRVEVEQSLKAVRPIRLREIDTAQQQVLQTCRQLASHLTGEA
ncbi:MAG: FliG C-terminal domain-containing protein [Planctomycetaceae bacterium]